MQMNRWTYVAGTLIVLACTSFRVVGAEPLANSTADHVAASNTGHGRDRDENDKTAVQQSNSEDDLKITQSIRRMLFRDKYLSTAHYVKIVTVEGVVTLRGPVVSEEERTTIANKATQVAGVRKVENQLEVGPQAASIEVIS